MDNYYIIALRNGLMKFYIFNIKSGRRKAFTLAEVLITLLIIGIIAAAVIPTLIDHFHKDMMAISLRKCYSTINQTLLAMTAEYDVNGDMNATGFFNGTDTLLGDNLVKYIKISKNCKTATGCFPPFMGDSFPPHTPKVASSSITGTHYSFITNDNMSYMVQPTGSGCIANFNGASSTHVSNHMNQICGLLWVDVNAFKPPNTYGGDIFLFYITNGVTPSLYPAGGRDDSKMQWSSDGVTAINCTKATPGGYACAGRIVDEDWQINY